MRSRLTTRVLLHPVCLLLALPLGAQTSSEDSLSEEITVTANREAVPVDEVGSSVTVITAEEIERRGPVTVADLLRTVPGLEITQAGGAGKATGARLRGGEGAQVLVLIDGVRVNGATDGGFDFAHLLTDNFERVEVLRGPQATYGSEALSGVISLTTRKGRGFDVNLLAEAGSREHERYAGSLSGSVGSFDYSLSTTDVSTDTVSQISGGEEPDPYDNATTSGRFGLALGDDGRLDLAVRSYEGDVALDGFGVEDLNAGAVTDGELVALGVEKQLLPGWRQRLRVSESTTDLLGSDPDTFFNNYDIRSELTLIEAQADVTVAEEATLNLGYAHEDRDGLNVGSFDESAQLDSWFAQAQWSPAERVHLTGAVRRDDHSVFGDETTFRVTGTAAFAEGRTRVHASAGTAFRAPNFNELFFPFSGDPDLRPETSEGFDLGVSQSFLANRLTVDLTYFDLEFEDLIQFDLATFLFGNVAQASSSGVELVARYRHRDLSLTFSHTYNETEDRATGRPLPRRPEHRSTFVALFTPLPKLDVAAQVFSVNDRIDSTGLAMDDYTRVDLNLRYEVLPWLTPFVRAENAADEDYEEVPGFTTPGSTFIVGVSLFR